MRAPLTNERRRVAHWLAAGAVAWLAGNAEVRAEAAQRLNSAELAEITAEIFDETTNARAWRCVELPGFLVLSRGNEDTLLAHARQIRLQARQLAPVQPPADWLRRRALVVPVVLFSREPESAAGGGSRSVRTFGLIGSEAIALNTWPFEHTHAPSRGTGGSPPPGPQVEPVVASYHSARVTERQPPPPRWFTDGYLFFLRTCRHEPDALVVPRLNIATSPTSADIERRRPTPWTTLALSMREVFHERSAAGVQPVERDRAREADLGRQSWLFVRWALLGDEARRRALWSFAAATAEQPPTDELFEKHFGMTVAALDVALTDVLISAGGALPEGRIAAPSITDSPTEAAPRRAHDEEVEMLRHALLESVAQLRRIGQ